jgi:3'-5' exonuclease
MLLDRSIIAFDIETMPDPDIGRRLLGMSGTDAEVVQEMVEARLKESEGQTKYPQLPWHRVVTVCATLLGPKTGRVDIRALGGETTDERAILEAFFGLIKTSEHPPRLVSWNGGSFDLPVLHYRAMMHGVQAPGFFRNDGELRFNNYQNRYHDMHLDLMDVLSGFGASSRVGLENLCKTLGLPGKSFIERDVYDHVLAGELPRVIEYCKLDTVLTLLAFLVYSHHRGDVQEPELRKHVQAVRETMSAQSYAGWQELQAALADWPRWGRT